MNEGSELLKISYLFRELPRQMLSQLAGRLSNERYGPRDVVALAGNIGEHLYLLTRGELEIRSEGHEPRRLTAPASFGEIHLLKPDPLAETLVAVSEAEVSLLRREDFLQFFGRQNDFTLAVARALAAYTDLLEHELHSGKRLTPAPHQSPGSAAKKQRELPALPIGLLQPVSELPHGLSAPLPPGWLGVADPLNSRILKLNEQLEPVWYLDTSLMQVHRPIQVRWPDTSRFVVLDGESSQVSCWNERAQQEWLLNPEETQWTRMELISHADELSLLLLDASQGRLDLLDVHGHALWSSSKSPDLGLVKDFVLTPEGRLWMLLDEAQLVHYDFKTGIIASHVLPGSPELIARSPAGTIAVYDSQHQNLILLQTDYSLFELAMPVSESPYRIGPALEVQWKDDTQLCVYDAYRLLIIDTSGQLVQRSLLQALRTTGKRNLAQDSAYHSLARRDATSGEALQELLRRVPLFTSAPDELFTELTGHIRTRVFNRGDLIVRNGDPGEELFIIRQGQAQVLSDNQLDVVATMGPGDLFGEVALMLGMPRNATVKAGTYCELYSFNQADLDRLLPSYPNLRERLLQLASERQTQQQLRSELEQSLLRDRIQMLSNPTRPVSEPDQSEPTSDGLLLWVRHIDKGQLACIDRSGNVLQLLDTEEGLLQPVAVHQNSAGLWVLDGGLNELQLLDPESLRLNRWFERWGELALEQPRDLVPAEGESFWIVNGGKGTLIQLDSAGEILQQLSIGRLPTSLQVLDNGNLLVSDLRQHTVSEYTTGGQEIWRYGTPRRFGREDNLLFAPEFARRLSNGHTLIADTGNSRVIEVALDGRIVWSLISAAGLNLPRPTKVLRLDNGHTLVEHSNRSQWLEVTSNQQAVWQYSLPAQGFKAD